MTAYTIDIVSDTVCPWCYIGHNRLTQAIKAHLSSNPSDTFKTRWLPYQLNPHFPRGQSIDKSAFYASKFGEQQAQMIFARLSAAGRESGVEFKFGGKTGNTWDSHRLIEFARQKEDEGDKGSDKKTNLGGVQTRLVEELFKDYFEREQDITSTDVLASAADRAGLPKEETMTVLKGDKYGDTVDKEVKEAQAEHISGVPHFTLQGQYEISGGQEPAAFMQIFQRIKQRETGKAVNGNGHI